MMRRGLLGAIFLFAAAVALHAQVSLTAQTIRSHFLLFERVDVVVTLTNIGDSDLQLNNDEGQPWLSFMVSGESGQHNFLPVHSERQSNFAPLTLKMNETKTLRVNITPLFTMRAEGNYRVSAVVDLPGAGQIVTDPVPFTIETGHVMQHNMRMVDTLERDYSLVRFSPDAQDTSLYLRVESPAENTVYANYALGPFVASVDPTMFFDPQGNVHVLQPMAQGTYLYTRTDPDGKLLAQRLFKSTLADDGSGMRVRPQLVKADDGDVYVSGGLQQDPNAPHERLSDTQHGQKIMAPTSTEQQVQQERTDRDTAPVPDSAPPGPLPPDSAPPLVGDPGAAAKAASPNSPSSTDMPPTGP
jgi:hypothetical protein